MADITRRGLIGGAALGAAGVAAGGVPEPAAARRPHRTLRADVAVVGAGLAGLTAARAIRRAGRSVVVIEARDRVGGRLLNHRINRTEITELGGQFVGPTQDRVLALARSLKVGSFATYNEGQNVQLFGGVRGLYPATGLPTEPDVADDTIRGLALDRMAREVPVAAPWRARRAAEWDGQTLETWKQQTLRTAAGKAAFDTVVKATWGAEPRDLSLLFVLFYIAAAGNEWTPGSIVRLITTGNGAQERRLRGGSPVLAERLARGLGARVELGAPVRAIRQAQGRVRVDAEGLTVHARRAIVAIPPALTGQIDYHPALPAKRAQLVQRMPQGSLIKCEAIYPEPFWRRSGLSGQAVADTGPARSTFDSSPPDGRPGVLFGFVGGHDARTWGPRSSAARRLAVLRNFVDYFGPEATHPRDYVEHDWSKEVWTRGCPVAWTAPGVLLDYGPWIRRPFGRVHWAGTETSTFWNGYMDGAVRSGERAAREALGCVPSATPAARRSASPSVRGEASAAARQ
jgi:monoamine oxidase